MQAAGYTNFVYASRPYLCSLRERERICIAKWLSRPVRKSIPMASKNRDNNIYIVAAYRPILNVNDKQARILHALKETLRIAASDWLKFEDAKRIIQEVRTQARTLYPLGYSSQMKSKGSHIGVLIKARKLIKLYRTKNFQPGSSQALTKNPLFETSQAVMSAYLST